LEWTEIGEDWYWIVWWYQLVLLLCCLVCVASGDSCNVVCGWSEQKLVRIGTELCDDISCCFCYAVCSVPPITHSCTDLQKLWAADRLNWLIECPVLCGNNSIISESRTIFVIQNINFAPLNSAPLTAAALATLQLPFWHQQPPPFCARYSSTTHFPGQQYYQQPQTTDQFAVPQFSIFFTTFRPELLFAFTRTQFIAAFELTRL
jgi:hypothetical protein